MSNTIEKKPSHFVVLVVLMPRRIRYIKKRRDTSIAIYVATRPILEACRQGEQQRGLMPRQWWWEQLMTSSDDEDATGSETQDDATVDS